MRIDSLRRRCGPSFAPNAGLGSISGMQRPLPVILGKVMVDVAPPLRDSAMVTDMRISQRAAPGSIPGRHAAFWWLAGLHLDGRPDAAILMRDQDPSS